MSTTAVIASQPNKHSACHKTFHCRVGVCARSVRATCHGACVCGQAPISMANRKEASLTLRNRVYNSLIPSEPGAFVLAHALEIVARGQGLGNTTSDSSWRRIGHAFEATAEPRISATRNTIAEWQTAIAPAEEHVACYQVAKTVVTKCEACIVPAARPLCVRAAGHTAQSEKDEGQSAKERSHCRCATALPGMCPPQGRHCHGSQLRLPSTGNGHGWDHRKQSSHHQPPPSTSSRSIIGHTASASTSVQGATSQVCEQARVV